MRKKIRRFNGSESSLVPAQIRTFVGTLAGNRSPLTEKDFSPEELQQVRDAIAKSRANPNAFREATKVSDGVAKKEILPVYDPTVDYRHYANVRNNVRNDFNIGPEAAMRNTLGRFSYEVNPQGHLIARDNYDFADDLVGKKGLPNIPKSSDYENLNAVQKVGKLVSDSFKEGTGGIRTLPSRTGSAFIGKDGRPIELDLGESPFKDPKAGFVSRDGTAYKKGGKVTKSTKPKAKKASAPKLSSAARRGDGCAKKGRTRGRMV